MSGPKFRPTSQSKVLQFRNQITEMRLNDEKTEVEANEVEIFWSKHFGARCPYAIQANGSLAKEKPTLDGQRMAMLRLNDNAAKEAQKQQEQMQEELEILT